MIKSEQLKITKKKVTNVESVQRWRKKYPERQKKLSLQYWLKIKSNPEKLKKKREYERRYYQKHREERIKSVRIFWEKNPDKRIYYKLRSNIRSKQRMLKLRFSVFNRDNFTCQYCGKSIPEVELEIDHKTPIAFSNKRRSYQDISVNIEDYITACKECNIGKGDTILKMFEKSSQVIT